MAKPHKYAQSHVTIDTDLAPHDVVAAAKRAAAETSGSGLPKALIGTVSLIAEDQSTLTFVIGSKFKKGMAFRVSVAARAAGSTVSSHITSYRTIQETVFFIPVGPKRIVMYELYRRYMLALARAVQQSDANANVTIAERVAA